MKVGLWSDVYKPEHCPPLVVFPPQKLPAGVTGIVDRGQGRVLVFGRTWHVGLLRRWLHLYDDDPALD